MFVKILLLVVFCATTVVIGLITKKSSGTLDGFILYGRALGPWLTAFAYGTSYFSAVVFIGYAGQFGWKYGLSATWIGIGNALIGSLLAWLVLGNRTRVMTRHLCSATMPEFFGARYDSKAIKIVASAIIFIFLIPYTASVYKGLSQLFAMAFNIPYAWCITAMAVLTGIYVILGGCLATAVNDLVQGIIMLVGIVAVIASVLSGQGGFSAAVRTLSEVTADGGGFTSLFGPQPLSLLGVVVLTSLGTWGLPQMVHKFYAIKDKRSIVSGTVISTVFAMVIAGGSYFLGGFGRLFSDKVLENGAVAYDSIVPTMLSGLSDLVIGTVVVLVLSASMSTLSSLVLTSSSTLTIDLIDVTLYKFKSEKSKLTCIRIFIAVFILLSVVIALDPPTFIAQLMGISWGALAGSFLAPFFYGLYWKKTTRAAVWACFASGVTITLGALLLTISGVAKASAALSFISSPINAGALAMLVGFIIVPAVTALSKKLPQDKIDSVFACYQTSK